MDSGKVIGEKSITLEMAHRLQYHIGKCRNIHGHSWKISLAISGKVKEGTTDSDDGMILDFAELKIALKELEDKFDHSIVLDASDPLVLLLEGHNRVAHMSTWWGEGFASNYGWVNTVPFSPTSERLATLWAKMLELHLPEYVELASVTVSETCTSEVIWIPE